MLSLVHPSSVIIKVAKVVCPHHLLKIVCSLHASAQRKNNPSFDTWLGCTATFWNALLAAQAFRRRPTYPASSSLKPSGRPSQFLSVRMSHYYVMWHMFFQDYPSITSIFHFVKQPKYPATCWTCRFEGVPCALDRIFTFQYPIKRGCCAVHELIIIEKGRKTGCRLRKICMLQCK